MSDYRDEFYRRYVSTFTGTGPVGLKPAPEGAWPVFEFKYLPHLSHLLPDDAILEVGCGPGLLLAYLASKGYRSLEGIDISAEQIEIAKAQGLRAQCADVFSFLEQRKGAYQAIIGLDFVEQFTKDEVLRLFRAMWRALKGGGVLLLQTLNGEGLFSSQVIYGDLTHCTVFTPASLAQALRLSGFSDVVFDETGPVPKSLIGLVRLVAWKTIKRAANLIRLIEAGKRQKVWTENLICCCRKA